MRVLIVDDDPNALALVSLALASLRVEISCCSSGAEALEQLSSFQPSLAIIDYQMPAMNGFELCAELKRLYADSYLPVILLTSEAELETKLEGFSAGADDYVTKPFQIQELEARAKAFLKIKALTDELKQTQDLLQEKEKQALAVQIAGAAAHELGQPLTSLLLECQLLRVCDPNSKEFKETVEDIELQAQRIREIMKTLQSLEKYRTVEYAPGMDIADLRTKS